MIGSVPATHTTVRGLLAAAALACGGGASNRADGSPNSDGTSASSDGPSAARDGHTGIGGSLRFFGAGVDDIDRLKIRVDDETRTDDDSPPVDVGATDFTIEMWLRGDAVDNDAAPITCGENIDWIYGNIVMDRDRFSQGRKWGLSLGAGKPVWGVTGADSSTTACASSSIVDGAWHHVAVQRRRSDGRLQVFVDGTLEAAVDGPDGDVSYPDDGTPGDFCGGPCTASDPFVVFAAEKHDAGAQFPSFSGWIDEIRFSTVLRYDGDFTPPTSVFTTDSPHRSAVPSG